MIRIAGPDQPIVALSDVKRHLRADYDDDDWTIQSYMDAAEAHIDGPHGVLGRCVLSQTWQASEAEVRCGIKPADVVSETENDDGTVDYVCAMPDYTVPAVRAAALLLIGHLMENRSAVVSGGWNELPLGVKSLLAPLRIWL